MESYLHKSGVTVANPPVNFGCNGVFVGADLAKSAADELVLASLCDGDPVFTWYRIRDSRVQATGWAAPDALAGDVKGLDAFTKPYGTLGTAFDVAPGDTGGRGYLYSVD